LPPPQFGPERKPIADLAIFCAGKPVLRVPAFLRVLRRFSDFLSQRTPACAGVRQHSPARTDPQLLAIAGPNIWGAQNPHPLFSRIVAEIGGQGPPFPPENIFSGFFPPGSPSRPFQLRGANIGSEKLAQILPNSYVILYQMNCRSMASVDTVLAASHPYLACPPWAEMTADGLCWLLYARRMLGGIKAAKGRRWSPWLRSASGGSFC
jgi:hypothetical protein